MDFSFPRITHNQREVKKWRNGSFKPPSFLTQLYLLLFAALTFSFSKSIYAHIHIPLPLQHEILMNSAPLNEGLSEKKPAVHLQQEECKCVEILGGIGQQNTRAAAAAARSCLILRTGTDGSRAGKLPRAVLTLLIPQAGGKNMLPK